MYRLLDGGAGDDARPESVLPRVLLCAFLALGTMVFSLALIGVDPHVAPAGTDASAALQGLYRLGAMALSFPILLLLGLPLADAVARARRWRSADALILLAVGSAWALSAWNTFTDSGAGRVYFDTASVVLVLVSLGRWLDARARTRAAEGLRAAAEGALRPVRRVEGAVEADAPLAEIALGDLVRVRAGEAVPVDGVVEDGRAFVDSAHLTGEEEPRAAAPGDRVLAGARALDGTLVVRAEAVGADRVAEVIAGRLADARADRAPLVRLADRVAGALIPVVVLLALGVGARHALAAGPAAGLLRGLTVLLIACPCALGLAIPLAYQTALGAAWRRGVLLRDGATLERLARVRRVLFDKTGTLTDGTPRLVEVRGARSGLERDEVLGLALALERASDHPLARALRLAGDEARAPRAEAIRVLPGVGVEGVVGGRRVRLSRAEPGGEADAAGPRALLAIDGVPAAELIFAAEPRRGAREAVAALRVRGLAPAVLTGDAPGPARALADELALPVAAELLPQDKLAHVQAAGGRGVLYVGDGINDAAALAGADVGCVLSDATDLARDEAQVHLLRGDLAELPRLLDLARRAVRVARGNLIWAFAYNAVGVALAATGRLTPVFAASAMVVSSVVVVLRSTRLDAADASGARTAGPAPRPASAPVQALSGAPGGA
jgi:Cu+-exporting ATPase